MRERSWLHWILAALLVALGGLAVALAAPAEPTESSESPRGKVTVVSGGQDQTVVLSELADGASRTITAGKHEIVVTRHGDRLEVTLDGEAVTPRAIRIHRSSRPDTCIRIERNREDEDADHPIEKHTVNMKWMTLDDADAGGEPIEIRITSDQASVGEEKDVMVFVGDGGPGDVMVTPDTEVIASDRVVYRCPEDGTVLRMDRDKATQETYLCPVCGRTMEKEAPRHVRFLRMAAPPAPPAAPDLPAPPASPAPPVPPAPPQ